MAGRPRPRPLWDPPRDRPPRVLIVRLSALGDVIHALPVAFALRRRLPQARLTWAVEDRAVDLLRGRPELDRLVVFPRRRLAASRRAPAAWARALVSFARDLRSEPYDAALDLQGNLKSGFVTRLSGARARLGPGRSGAREGGHLFTNRHFDPPPRLRHRVERNLALLGALLGGPVAWEDPGLPADPAAAADAERLLSQAGLPARDYVVLHPGTSEFGSFKRWPAARFADLARTWGGRGARVAVTCAPSERPLAERVARAADGAAVALATPDLRVLAEVIRRARLFVSADTGPLHLAALARTPLLGLFGPKDEEVYGPWGRRDGDGAGRLAVAARGDVACRPCRLRRCPDPVCMRGLCPETVDEAARAVLGEARGPRAPGHGG